MKSEKWWYEIDQLDPHSNLRSEKISTGMGRYLQNFLKLVISEKQPFIIDKLLTLGKKLNNSFPYRDTQNLFNYFHDNFLEDDTLNFDLSSYWETINVSLYYIMKGKTREIYRKSLFVLLNKSFFDTFDQYKFLEEEIKSYPNLYSEYLIHEQLRIYILHYLFVEKRC